MNDINITCVAFHGHTTPPGLRKLVKSCSSTLQHILGSSYTKVFIPLSLYQIHATMIGLEVDIIDDELYSHWAILNRRGNHQPVNINGFLQVVTWLVHAHSSFYIRFCGYTKAYCTCTDEGFKEWDCLSSKGEFHSCGRTGYEGSFYGFSPGSIVITGWPVTSPQEISRFPHTLYSFRRDCENAGFPDKYHSDTLPYWKDDDCYIKIGHFPRTFPGLPAVIQKMREFMADQEPQIIELNPEHMNIILYKDSSLAEKSIIKKVSLQDVVKNPDTLKQMVQYVKKYKK